MQITVKGEATRRHQPEEATLTLTLGFEGAEKSEVVRETTQLVNRFTAATENLRDGEDAPVTWWALLPIGVRSWRPWSQDGEQLPLRHAAQSTARLCFVDFRALSALIDQWGGEDGVRVGGVAWSLTKERLETERAAVLAEAVTAARKRAQVIATAADRGPVEFLEIADIGLLGGGGEPDLPQPMAMRAGSLARDDSGIDLMPEEIEVAVSIHARFQAV